MTSPKTYFVITRNGQWGPIPWQSLRRWLALGWLPKDLHVAEHPDAGALRADSIERLWNIAGRPFVAKDPSAGLEATGGPVSSSLRHRLIDDLEWPGKVELLNYFSGDSLRLELEKIFLSTDRPEFRDPEWPSVLKRDWFAEAAIWKAAHDAVPATDRQRAVLEFFGRRTAGVTKGAASESIESLFTVPGNKEKWDQHRGWSAEPATERQLFRLRFAGRRLNLPLPENLSKQAAHDLIDDWFRSRPELEDAYVKFKIDFEEREIAEDIVRIEQEEDLVERMPSPAEDREPPGGENRSISTPSTSPKDWKVRGAVIIATGFLLFIIWVAVK